MIKKTKTSLFLSFLGILAILLVGYFFIPSNSSSSTTTGSKIIATVTTGNIKTEVTSQGTLEPRNYVDVGAQVSGQIKKLHVDIGDDVTEGDLIAEIDPEIKARSRAITPNSQCLKHKKQKNKPP